MTEKATGTKFYLKAHVHVHQITFTNAYSCILHHYTLLPLLLKYTANLIIFSRICLHCRSATVHLLA